jgi:hypothetical protein
MPTMAAAPLPSPALGAAAQSYESGTAGSSRHGGGAKEPATAPVGVPASHSQHPWISSSSSYDTGHVLLSQAGDPLRRKALRRTSGRTRLSGAPSPRGPPRPPGPPPHPGRNPNTTPPPAGRRAPPPGGGRPPGGRGPPPGEGAPERRVRLDVRLSALRLKGHP